ncbi:hypothetical protein E8E14_014475 [Neopestalotiopsis sp. 37M]|nr:hypothetical protein E8E14_014475 [Neopestalotiopsis sp. 37M]
MDEFRPYKFQTEYKNVVIIVSSGQSQEEGWRRDQIFDIDSENLTDYWDAKVPPDVVNSLWFWTPCTVRDAPEDHGVYDYVYGSDDYWGHENFKEELRAYDHSCGRIFGLNTSQPPYQAKVNDVVPISFTDDGLRGNTTTEELSQGYKAHLGSRSLQIDHCLAEPVVCQVRAANTLILIVVICVLFKIATCSFLLLTLKDVSLVTPGDAIESFISNPDHITNGLGSLALHAAQGLETNPRKVYSTVRNPELTLSLQPRRWVAEARRVYSAVYRGIWVQAYYPIFLLLAALLVGTVFSGLLTEGDYKTFGKSEDPHTLELGYGQLSYLSTLIVKSSMLMSGVDEENQYLIEVARGKVRWGAMSLPQDLAAKVKASDDEPVMHLGFGTEEHNVRAPQTGTLYA